MVLATGQVPETAFGEDFKAKKLEEGEEKKDDFVVPATPLGLRLFNLEYSQDGAAGSVQLSRFPRHLLPYESRRTVFTHAGPVRRDGHRQCGRGRDARR